MSHKLSLLLIGLLGAMLVFTGCASREPATVRVLTYNIHHGEGMDERIDLERIADVIRESDADLVALQEVDRGVKRSNKVDQPARLAALTGMQTVFYKNIDHDGGDYGNAVLSRLPIEFHKNHYLPRSLSNEQRGLLEAHVRVNGRKLIFLATHLDYHTDDGERMASIAQLRQLVGEHQGMPIIVAGDLNALPDSRVIKEVTSFLGDAFRAADEKGLTFPADKPNRRIDYVLLNPDSGLRCVEHRVLDESVASDHRPVLAVLELER